MTVGIVVVSHSSALAEAAVALAVEMVHGNEPAIAIAAGMGDGRFGTDATEVAAAITRVSSGDGVLVIPDLGSAVLSAELALELSSAGRDRVRITPAPFVEGLVAAVVAAAGGGGLDQVAAEAEAAADLKRAHLAEPAVSAGPGGSGPVEAAEAVEEATVVNEVGLHARAAAYVVRLAGRFDAELFLENLGNGRGPVPAVSLTGVLSLDAGRGATLRITASGAQAAEAAAALRAATEHGFGEGSR
jgi:dihydroxyacetone kinase phosphotransfer subunit